MLLWSRTSDHNTLEMIALRCQKFCNIPRTALLSTGDQSNFLASVKWKSHADRNDISIQDIFFFSHDARCTGRACSSLKRNAGELVVISWWKKAMLVSGYDLNLTQNWYSLSIIFFVDFCIFLIIKCDNWNWNCSNDNWCNVTAVWDIKSYTNIGDKSILFFFFQALELFVL